MPLGINAPTGRFNGSLGLKTGNLYPKATPSNGPPYPHLHSAVRRTARAGATLGVGLQRREARFRPRWLRPVSFTLVGSGSDAREISQFSTRSGVLRASRGRPARATQRVARATPRSPPKAVGFGLSPIPPRRSAPGRTGRRPKGSQKQRFSVAASGERILRPRRPVKDAVRPLRIRGLRADRYHGDLATRSRPKFQPKAKLSSPPRVSLTAAPLPLRHVFARLRDSTISVVSRNS